MGTPGRVWKTLSAAPRSSQGKEGGRKSLKDEKRMRARRCFRVPGRRKVHKRPVTKGPALDLRDPATPMRKGKAAGEQRGPRGLPTPSNLGGEGKQRQAEQGVNQVGLDISLGGKKWLRRERCRGESFERPMIGDGDADQNSRV